MVKYTFEMEKELERQFKDIVYCKTGLERGSIKNELIEAVKLYVAMGGKTLTTEEWKTFQDTIRSLPRPMSADVADSTKTVDKITALMNPKNIDPEASDLVSEMNALLPKDPSQGDIEAQIKKNSRFAKDVEYEYERALHIMKSNGGDGTLVTKGDVALAVAKRYVSEGKWK